MSQICPSTEEKRRTPETYVPRLGGFRRGEPQEAGITYYAVGVPEAAVALASQPGVVPIAQEVLDA